MSGSAAISLGANGVNPDMKASISEVFSLSERGRYIQIRVRNTQGQLIVRSISVEADRAQVTEGTTADE
jgi:hypothetical protein